MKPQDKPITIHSNGQERQVIFSEQRRPAATNSPQEERQGFDLVYLIATAWIILAIIFTLALLFL